MDPQSVSLGWFSITFDERYQKELNKWKHIPHQWIGRLITVKILVFPIGSIDSVQSQSESQKIILRISVN